MTEESKFTIMDALQRDAKWGEANLITSTVCGSTIKGWGLIRASNTTPVLVLRFEADSEEELRRIQTSSAASCSALHPTSNCRSDFCGVLHDPQP